MVENDGLPRGWAKTPLGEIVSFEYGKGLRKDRRDESGNIPVFGSNGVIGHHSNPLVNVPSLIVGRKGTAGAVHISRGPCWPIDTTYFVIPPRGINLQFLFYMLSSLKLGYLDKSTAIPGLNRNDAYALEVSIPPTPEQERIVAKIELLFTQLDTGVAELKHAKTQLKRYRQSVLKAAVEGELTREWRKTHKDEIEPASVLLERILVKRRVKWEEDELAKMHSRGKEPKNDKWKDKYREPSSPDIDDLPELPGGWVWATVEQLTAHEPNSITDGPFGSKLKTAHYTDEGPRVIRLQNIGDGVFYDEKAHISWEHFETLRKHEIFAGDLIIGALGATLPRACVIPEYVGPAIVKADCMRFKPHSDIADVRYLNAAINSQNLKKITANIIHGIGRPRLNQGEVKSLPIPLPPLSEQENIAAKVDRRLSVADEIEKELEQNLILAERLRQSILKKAFEGRLVPQDPSDERASVLMERILVEKNNSDVKGRMRNQKVKDESVVQSESKQLELFSD